MSTTTLKLPDELKQKAVAAAQDLGVTPHAFMVDAIRQATEAAEQRKQFVEETRSTRIRQALQPPASSYTVRNGVPLLRPQTGTMPVTLEMVNKLRDEIPG
ncbi:CopG family ribbon-helix-helix protein [Duganella violaceipulchra]|uniref:DUF1778 domain-containing protein n=1 Tax=Duganella violaceipulchra TaxID=2849652 RepID=A0AA41HJ92_9BURK|nr:hypothetical protein [Duganella violaceicalia]MBV6325176.1 hypothetical protein [Duganella violaceicalia]MCP2011602.1 hypothetical protein [Duganella violaceicalia]